MEKCIIVVIFSIKAGEKGLSEFMDFDAHQQFKEGNSAADGLALTFP